MLPPDVVQKVHNAVCAVGYLTVPLEEWREEPGAYPLQVCGSGFLVRPATVITNKHVIDRLLQEAHEYAIPESQLFISFIAPTQLPRSLGTVRMIRRRVGVESGRIDIALIEIKGEPQAHFQDIDPLPIADSPQVQVSEAIFVCGYPYGNKLLEKGGKVYRYGPILQRGYVSGLSPFTGAEYPDEILLDVRTADKMSGSPVLRSATSEVIGIHHEGTIDSRGIATTSFAIPLTRDRVQSWLTEFDEAAAVD
jgi:V8-like Glu-specific endopeptidase